MEQQVKDFIIAVERMRYLFEAVMNHIEKAEPSFEERFRWETAARLYTSFENMTPEKAIEHADGLIKKLKETQR